MPRGFTPDEKEQIRRTLMEEGRRLFEVYGLRKTSVEDLARAASISKGAFYKFFDSKEALFMEILEDYESKFRQQIFSYAYEPQENARSGFKEMLRQSLLSWESFPMLKAFSQDDYVYLLRKVPPERVQEHIQNDDRFIDEFIEGWEAQGHEIRYPAKSVSGLMKALFFVSIHKDDFGSDEYPDTMNLLIEIIGDQLIPENT